MKEMWLLCRKGKPTMNCFTGRIALVPPYALMATCKEAPHPRSLCGPCTPVVATATHSPPQLIPHIMLHWTSVWCLLPSPVMCVVGAGMERDVSGLMRARSSAPSGAWRKQHQQQKRELGQVLWGGGGSKWNRCVW